MTRGESDTRGRSTSTHLVLAGKGSQRSSPRTNWEETKAGVAEEKRKPRGGGWGGGGVVVVVFAEAGECLPNSLKEL